MTKTRKDMPVSTRRSPRFRSSVLSERYMNYFVILIPNVGGLFPRQNGVKLELECDAFMNNRVDIEVWILDL